MYTLLLSTHRTGWPEVVNRKEETILSDIISYPLSYNCLGGCNLSPETFETPLEMPSLTMS